MLTHTHHWLATCALKNLTLRSGTPQRKDLSRIPLCAKVEKTGVFCDTATISSCGISPLTKILDPHLLRPHPHRTRARKLECKCFDVACVQCEHSHSGTHMFHLLCVALRVLCGWGLKVGKRATWVASRFGFFLYPRALSTRRVFLQPIGHVSRHWWDTLVHGLSLALENLSGSRFRAKYYCIIQFITPPGSKGQAGPENLSGKNSRLL